MSSAEVKILIPDNELPTREIQFNPLMMDFPVQFEVHIVKSAFEAVFGVGAKPEMRDYLYFKQYMNRMYEVDAIAEADDFLYEGSYWRVSLVPYQQRTAVMFPNTTEGKNVETETKALVSSAEEKFAEERQDDFEDVRKPNQYNTIGSLCNDYVRRILDKKLIIKEENVYNQWTIISKYHYNLGSLLDAEEGVEYQYKGGWTKTEDRAFSFWVRPQYVNPIGINVLITSIVDNGGKVQFNTAGLPSLAQTLKVGNWIAVSGTNSYNGIQKIIDITGNNITLDTSYIDDVVSGTPKFNREASNNFISYDNDSTPLTTYVEFTYTPNWFIMKINNEYYKWKFASTSTLSLTKGNWFAFVINLNAVANQLSLYVYSTPESQTAINPAQTAKLTNLFHEVKGYTPEDVVTNQSWKLLGCKTDLTNIRIWKKPIEEELQTLILSQYVVKDTHLTLLLDNAAPQLLLDKQTNPR